MKFDGLPMEHGDFPMVKLPEGFHMLHGSLRRLQLEKLFGLTYRPY